LLFQTQQRAAHARALTKVVALFKDLGVDVLTRWRDAQRQLVESDAWRSDPELDALPSLDVLLAFEDFARVQEREFEEQMRRAQVDKTRRERKAREGFKELLHELVDRGALRARSKWKQVYPELAHDARYTALLGVPGSNPLELFWDVVDGLDQALDRKIAVVSAAIAAAAPAAPAAPASGSEEGEAQRGFAVGPETTLDDLMKVVKNDPEVKKMSEKDLELVYMTVRPGLAGARHAAHESV
jgi:pre-mRNA-processing factor 40